MATQEKTPLLSSQPHARADLYNAETLKARGQKYTLVIHGGAGTMDKARSTPELRAQYKAALARALMAGYGVLRDGGEAMDAAVAAVSSMEGMIWALIPDPAEPLTHRTQIALSSTREKAQSST